ncbi:MAG: hypothetical protein VX938_02135, partial [Myxococcota bacterium]|nr:hypothetical protein [Myxococcota bacterium]MEE2780157.1 hypothetical protein [Myxococcota bacterium]
GPMTVSAVPPETFSDNRVNQIAGLPGRLLRRGISYDISGSTDIGMTKAWFLIFEETGGDALLAVPMSVANQSFNGAVSLGTLSAGAYGWAVVATGGEDPIVQRSIRFSLVD